MSVTFGGVAIQNARTSGGAKVAAFKDWGYFGANGTHLMSGGTRGRRWTVTGIATQANIATYEGWLVTSETAVINGETFENVMFLSIGPGEAFTNAADGVLYRPYTITLLQLLE